MSLSTRWIDLLGRAAAASKATRTLLTPVGVLIFGVFTAAFVVAGLFVDRLLALPKLVPDSLRIPLAVPVLVVGVLAVAWSAGHFIRVRGTPVPFNPPPRLVATGPYRYVRNPMLTGVFLILFGLGLGLGSAALVLLFTPLYVLLNVWELKHIEEPELERRLGREYVEYRQRTPMFIPFLRR